ncbi:hypothetical protein EV1_028341 [Malus domestica]|nr:eukaryotic peptide chain release factor GTP-binding subunit-like isoform X1 [Malus domestica]
MDGKRHLNVAFFGHTWSGKSTIVGHIVSMTNQIDAETVKKYETVAKDKRLGSWFTAYGMDTNKDWRRKGKVGVGRAHLETESSRYTILDVPGHDCYDCLNMIKDIEEDVGKVDIGVLVVCALKDPCDIWEYAFKKNGEKWTRDHITFAKELHVSKLFVVINQMDSPSVNWSQQRYDDTVSRMREIIKPLRSYGNRVQYLPLSGINGSNMKEPVDDGVCPWWHGPTLFESFDSTEFWWTSCAAPFRMPICERAFETNTTAAAYIGYVESGSVRVGDTLILMPQQVPVSVDAIFINPDWRDRRVERARYGEYIMLNLSGIEVEAVTDGEEVACVACEHEETDYEGTDDDSDTQVEVADDKINTEKVEVADNEVNTEEVEDPGLELLELVCMFCEAGPFPTYDALEVHQNSHSYVECDVCGKRFRNSLNLDVHMYCCHKW